MKWLYDYEYEWMGKGKKDPIVSIFLRPTIFNPEGEEMIGKIVKLNLIAAEYIMNNEKMEKSRKDKEFAQIYFEELRTTDYYIKDADVKKDNEIYLAGAYIYVKEPEGFTPQDTFEWVKTYFTIKGYEHSEFERTDPGNFRDMNPLYNMLIKAGQKIVEEEEKEKQGKKKKRKKRRKKL